MTQKQEPESQQNIFDDDTEQQNTSPADDSVEQAGLQGDFEDAVEDTAVQDEFDNEDVEAQPDEQAQEPLEQAEYKPEFEPTVESVLEAVLFASDEPLTITRLCDIIEISAKQVREHVENLNAKYQAAASAFRIEQIAGGFQMLTLPPYNHWLKKLLRARDDSKLSTAALETLAIIAYKQPIIRADIEAVRGVSSGEVIRSLMYKGLVKIVGRAEVLGRPMLYGTTKKFLGVFGLNALKDLPKIEELKKPES